MARPRSWPSLSNSKILAVRGRGNILEYETSLGSGGPRPRGEGGQGSASGSCSINAPSSVSPDAASSQLMIIRAGAATPTFISTPGAGGRNPTPPLRPRAVANDKKTGRIAPAAVLRVQALPRCFSRPDQFEPRPSQKPGPVTGDWPRADGEDRWRGRPRSAEASVTLQPWRASALDDRVEIETGHRGGKTRHFRLPHQLPKALVMLVDGVLAGDDDAAPKLGLEMGTPVELLTVPRIKPGRRRGGQTGNKPRSMMTQPDQASLSTKPRCENPAPEDRNRHASSAPRKAATSDTDVRTGRRKNSSRPHSANENAIRNDEGNVAKRDGRERGCGGYLPRRPHPRNAHRREIINRSPHAQEINPRAGNAQTRVCNQMMLI